MKVAMLASGQPRYSRYFFDNFSRLKGENSFDLYFYMWDNYVLDDTDLNIFDSIGSAESQIIRGLPENCKIKKYVQVSEPTLAQLFPLGLNELVEKTSGGNAINDREFLKNSLHKLYLQRYSALQCFNLIEENYDCIIRYRPDCFLSKDVYLDQLNLKDFIYTPKNLCAGGEHIAGVARMNDKFAIGSHKNMEIYFQAFDSLYENQMENKETIQEETSLSYHLHKNGVNFLRTLEHFMVKIEKGDGGFGLKRKL
jgi:hypothetical protein